MSSSNKPPMKEKEKAFPWNEELMRRFIDMLLEYQHKFGRDQAFSWVEMTTQFEEATNMKCGKETLKNKHSRMKERWKNWKDLKHGETGLGWDSSKGNIDATPEWWEKKIKENPKEFRKLRRKGIPPELEELWDQIYEGTVATGRHCVAPSMDPPPSPTVVEDSGVNADDVEVNSDFVEAFGAQTVNSQSSYMQNIVRGLGSADPVTLNSSPGSSSARRMKRVVGTSASAPLLERNIRQSQGSILYQKHVSVVEETSKSLLAILKEQDAASTNQSREKPDEIVDIIESMMEEGLLVEGDPLWCFSVQSLVNKDQGKMFLALRSNKGRKSWLQWNFDHRGGAVGGHD